MEKRTPVTVRLPKETLRDLDMMKCAMKTTRTDVIVQAVSHYMEVLEKLPVVTK